MTWMDVLAILVAGVSVQGCIRAWRQPPACPKCRDAPRVDVSRN